jgi:hypothetical protein
VQIEEVIEVISGGPNAMEDNDGRLNRTTRTHRSTPHERLRKTCVFVISHYAVQDHQLAEAIDLQATPNVRILREQLADLNIVSNVQRMMAAIGVEPGTELGLVLGVATNAYAYTASDIKQAVKQHRPNSSRADSGAAEGAADLDSGKATHRNQRQLQLQAASEVCQSFLRSARLRQPYRLPDLQWTSEESRKRVLFDSNQGQDSPVADPCLAELSGVERLGGTMSPAGDA